MKKGLGTIVMLLTMITFTAIGQNLQDFKSKLANCKMKLNIPTGYIESKVIENHDMGYDYAIKSQDNDFELRYAIRPITQTTYANDTEKKMMEDHIAFRNSSYKVILMTIIINVAGGDQATKLQVYDESAVKKEFNADWGATTIVETKSDFGKGFKTCMIVTIHKKDVADAYFFFMFSTKEQFMKYALPLFHSLQFED
jgi:hypothetical protein